MWNLLKAGVEEQIEGVPDVFSLLLGLFGANKLNLSGMFEVAYGSGESASRSRRDTRSAPRAVEDDIPPRASLCLSYGWSARVSKRPTNISMPTFPLGKGARQVAARRRQVPLISRRRPFARLRCNSLTMFKAWCPPRPSLLHLTTAVGKTGVLIIPKFQRSFASWLAKTCRTLRGTNPALMREIGSALLPIPATK